MKGAARPAVARLAAALLGFAASPPLAYSAELQWHKVEPPMDLGPKDLFASQSRGHAGKVSARPSRRRRSGLHARHPRRRRYIRYQRTGGGR